MSDFTYETSRPFMTANDMWDVMNSKGGSNNWGIDGYESPKIYFDFKKQKSDREMYALNQAVWAKKQHYPKPKEHLDKDGNKIIPQKKNFIDEYIQMANSNFSKAKFDAYVEMLKEKGKSLEEIEGIKKQAEAGSKDKGKTKMYRHDRSTFISEIMKNENKKYVVPESIQEIVEKAKERQARYSSPVMSSSDKIKMKYKGKSSLDKGERVTFLSEAEFVGEKLPFYNTKPEEDEEGGSGDDSKNKNKIPKKLFQPKKEFVLQSSPKWSMKNPTKIDKSYEERRTEQYNAKVEELRKSWDDRRIKFVDDVSTSFFLVNDKKKGAFKYKKPFEFSDQYKTSKEQSPSKYPGPQQYFKTPYVNFNSKSPKKGEDEASKEDPEGSPKVYYMNRDKTDKRLYKPMKKYVF